MGELSLNPKPAVAYEEKLGSSARKIRCRSRDDSARPVLGRPRGGPTRTKYTSSDIRAALEDKDTDTHISHCAQLLQP
jgi:hypothetical protein